MEERFLDQEFQTITEDIITHPLFLQLRQLQHHGGENNLYDHSVDTAACAYRMARRFHMREDRVRAVTRAALHQRLLRPPPPQADARLHPRPPGGPAGPAPL